MATPLRLTSLQRVVTTIETYEDNDEQPSHISRVTWEVESAHKWPEAVGQSVAKALCGLFSHWADGSCDYEILEPLLNGLANADREWCWRVAQLINKWEGNETLNEWMAKHVIPVEDECPS